MFSSGWALGSSKGIWAFGRWGYWGFLSSPFFANELVMQENRTPAPGVELFWLDAEANDCADNPLERELCYRLEAAQRFSRMIAEAEEIGRDEVIDALIAQQVRMSKLAQELQDALKRYHPTP